MLHRVEGVIEVRGQVGIDVIDESVSLRRESLTCATVGKLALLLHCKRSVVERLVRLGARRAIASYAEVVQDHAVCSGPVLVVRAALVVSAVRYDVAFEFEGVITHPYHETVDLGALAENDVAALHLVLLIAPLVLQPGRELPIEVGVRRLDPGQLVERKVLDGLALRGDSSLRGDQQAVRLKDVVDLLVQLRREMR